VPNLLGFQGDKPTPLLFVETSEKEIHLPVEFLVRMFLRSSTMGASASVDVAVLHGSASSCKNPLQLRKQKVTSNFSMPP
jgi:hypothetical protein